MRRLMFSVFAVLAVIGVAGCELRTIEPPGEGVVRYRDEVFSEVQRTNGIVYGSAVKQDGTTISLALDLYRPVGDDVSARPLIIFVHGGSFCCGSRTSPEIVDQANVFARKGYVTASISYRLSPGGCTAITVECITAIRHAREDGQAAVRFFRRHAATYGIDVQRIAIGGSSAGAITALEVAFGPEEVGDSGNPGYDSSVDAAVSLSGAKIIMQPERGEAPALLFHGTADTLVPYAWAVGTADASEAAGHHLELVSWTGDGHVPYVTRRQQILDETTNFLWWTLNLANAAA